MIIGTVLVLGFARQGTTVGRILSWKPLVIIGLVSYSAYLWHQPVFVFARLYFFENEIPGLWYAGFIILTLALSLLSWHFIEQPFRKIRVKTFKPVFAWTSVAVIVTATVGISINMITQTDQRISYLASIIKGYGGLDDYCEGKFDFRCQVGDHPVAVI